MRTISKLLLLAITAIAAIALAAPGASAQVEVTDEDDANAHCPAVTISAHTPGGGCEVSAATAPETTADINIHVHGVMGEINTSQCENTFDAVIQETGHGFVYNQVLSTPPEGICGLEPCDEVVSQGVHPNRPWPFHMSEALGVLWLDITFCVRNVNDDEGTGNPCTVAIPVGTIGDHSYVASTLAPGSETNNPADSASRCSQAGYLSLNGTWVIDDSMDDIEIEH